MAKFIEELGEGFDEAPAVPEGTGEGAAVESIDRQPQDEHKLDVARKTLPAIVEDLDTNPKFREWKSKLDRRYEQERKEKETLAARLAQYEQTLDTLATKDLDDTGKLAYENRKLKQALQMIEQEKQITEGRQRVFNRIRQKAGVPIPDEVFDEATDADHAWELAVDYMFQRNTPQQKQAARTEKKEANQVYLGSNSATTDDWEVKAARLLKNKDAIGYARHMLERKE